MTRYEQGWSEQQAENKWGDLVVMGLCLGVAAVVLLSGCATTAIAEKGPLTQVGDHATLRGLVRVAQMGEDCSNEQEALKQTIAGIFVGAGLPQPSSVDVRPLAGSSYCGFAQGTANEVVTLELGARNTAVAEVALYWSTIIEADLKKAQAVLTAMRPLRPPSKVVKNPTK